jgi:hypothetical protein
MLLSIEPSNVRMALKIPRELLPRISVFFDPPPTPEAPHLRFFTITLSTKALATGFEYPAGPDSGGGRVRMV